MTKQTQQKPDEKKETEPKGPIGAVVTPAPPVHLEGFDFEKAMSDAVGYLYNHDRGPFQPYAIVERLVMLEARTNQLQNAIEGLIQKLAEDLGQDIEVEIPAFDELLQVELGQMEILLGGGRRLFPRPDAADEPAA